MQSKWKSTKTKWFQGMIEGLVLFPVFLAIGNFIIPSKELYVWVGTLSFLFFMGSAFRTFVPDKKRWFYIIFTLLVSLLTPTFLGEGLIYIIIIYVINIIVTFRGILYSEQEWRVLFPTSFMWSFGLPSYFVGYFFYKHIERLSLYLDVFTWAGILLIISILFVSNNEHLKSATLSKESKPFVARALKVQNRLFIIITLLIIVIITNFNILQSILLKMITLIIKGIIAFMSLFDREEVIEEQPVQQNEAAMPPMEPGEPSLIALILEKIMMIVFYIAIVIAVIMLVRLLSKKIGVWVKSSWNWLKRFFNRLLNLNNQDEEENLYFDEKESTFDWKDWRKKNQEKVKELISTVFNREPKWKDLTNNEKVRYIYRNTVIQQIKRGFKFNPYKTPIETIAELKEKSPDRASDMTVLENLYGKARYGKEEINNEEVQKVTSLIDSSKT